MRVDACHNSLHEFKRIQIIYLLSLNIIKYFDKPNNSLNNYNVFMSFEES